MHFLETGKVEQTRESMEYDVVVVGAGPAGLSAGIRLKQLAQQSGREISVCILEKGSEPGAHILSGAIMDPRAINELLPNWKADGAPIHTPVTEDQFMLLSETGATTFPQWVLPACFKNHGNYVVSLSNVTKWLASQAENLGVEIFPGFAAAEVLYHEDGRVKGVATGNMGVGKDDQPTGNFQMGMELHGKYTLFAEGARGHLGKQLISKFKLDAGRDPQSYGIGLKEVWEIDPAKHKPGLVIHTAGWPLDSETYGGAFLYHLDNHQVSIGYVVGLGYANPWLSPFEEFQRYKTHPKIRHFLEGGKRIGYGARAIAAGGLNCLPKFTFPGGALIGCDAGFLNASRIKGSHGAIKSGMLCAEAVAEELAKDTPAAEPVGYATRFEKSWLKDELYRARNFKPAMAKGLWMGTLIVGIDQKLFGGKAPWTLHNTKADHETLKPAAQCKRIDYPKPDGKLTFDRLSSVFLSGTSHEENQPAHLTLKNAAVPVATNLTQFAGPESRYCPAGVYEYLDAAGNPTVEPVDGARLQINAQNCVHCKTCDIKDPTQNIVWVTPEGGGGPNYTGT
ncbi:electron transfer flavoprotein-ubiquinone oxidoreductase [beta proteobacterium MWH-UniP1]